MKNTTIFTTILLLFITITLKAQETTWFDANWQVTTEDMAEYYRPAPEKKGDKYWIADYYKDNTIQMEGFSYNTTPNEELYDGLVIYYHPNGKPFHKANYKNGKNHGVRNAYYDTGELQQTGNFVNGKRVGIWKTFYKSGKIETKGKYKNNEKVGIWKTFHKNVY